MKNSTKLVAAIDIGSHALYLKIVEMDQNARMKVLENIRRTISLGRDTFAIGKINFETLNETCEILKGFKQMMADYKIKSYTAVATSAIREATNRDYILDQIKLKTGLNINVLTNSEERYLAFQAINDHVAAFNELRKENCIIIDIGSGSIQFSIYDDDKLILSKNIKLGSLRIREILSKLEGRTLNFPKVMEEYIESNIDNFILFQNNRVFKHLIAIGGEIKLINKLCTAKDREDFNQSILRADFLDRYNELLYLSPHTIIKKYHVPQENSDILLPTMMVLKKFIDVTTSDKIYTPTINLVDGVISEMLEKNKQEETNILEADVLSLCRTIGAKFKYQQEHAEDVENKSLILFNSLKKLHGLGKRERTLLQLAAILHDIGKFISYSNHYVNSYNAIMSSDILGLNETELKIVANIAKYHSTISPSLNHESYMSLDGASRLIVSKLVAIIRIADALDRSHKQKITDIKVKYAGKEVIITVSSTEDILLEQWTFELKSEFFKEVFGVTPILKIGRTVSNV